MTYFVYLSRVVRSLQYQYRIVATTDYEGDLKSRGRTEVPAIWKVVGVASKEEAKATVLTYEAHLHPVPNRVSRIR